MLKQLRRLGEEFGAFTEWVRIYPLVLTKDGRELLMEDLLALGQMKDDFLEEMVTHAKRVLKLKEEIEIKRAE